MPKKRRSYEDGSNLPAIMDSLIRSQERKAKPVGILVFPQSETSMSNWLIRSAPSFLLLAACAITSTLIAPRTVMRRWAMRAR